VNEQKLKLRNWRSFWKVLPALVCRVIGLGWKNIDIQFCALKSE